MKIIIFICLIFAISSEAMSNQKCLDLFNAENYVQVIKECESQVDQSAQMKFIYFAATMFLEIDYSRINHIFYNGKMMGSFFYKHKTGNNLYTNLEKYHLNEFFPQLVEFADQGFPLAQLLAAKVFYINIDIIKRGEQKESSGEIYHELDAGMQKYYFPYLENILASDPNNVEVLALLGLESFRTEFIEGQYGSPNKYFSIKDQKLFDYLLRAHELGHPGLQEVIDGVAAWKAHIRGLKKQAEGKDSQALFLLGQNAYSKSHDNSQYLTEAFKYFKQAADLGHVDALRSVNRFYGSEFFDKEKYMSTLKQMVKLKDTSAMLRLGDIYLCNDRKEEAKALYEKAIELNDPIAPYALDDLKFDGKPSAGCR